MSRLFYLVLILTVLITTRATWVAVELCRQDSNACSTIRAINDTIINLVEFLKNKVYQLDDCQVCDNLQGAEFVTNLDEFYVEMTKYEAEFEDLNISRVAYINTLEWHNLSAEATLLAEESNYSTRFLNIRSYTAYLVQELKMNFVLPDTPPSSTTVAPQWKNLNLIYSETYYVINKLRNILPNCRVCDFFNEIIVG